MHPVHISNAIRKAMRELNLALNDSMTDDEIQADLLDFVSKMNKLASRIESEQSS